MRYIKLTFCALKNMWKNKLIYSVLIFELILVEIITLSFGAKCVGISKSREICNVFNDTNMYYFMKYRFTNKDLREVLSADTRHKVQVVDIPCMVLEDGENEYTAYGYNDLMMNHTKCNLVEGVWFHQYKGENIPVITAESSLPVGETIKVGKGRNQCLLEIIGRISEESYIFSSKAGASNNLASLDSFITHPDVQLIIPFQSENIKSIKENNTSSYDVDNPKMIFLSDVGVKEKFVNQCKAIGSLTDISQMRENYDKTIENELIVNLLIMIVFVIISIVGIVGFNGMQSAKNRKMYVIHYFCGGKNMDFVFIEITKNACVILLSIVTFLIMNAQFGFLDGDKLSVVSNTTMTLSFTVLLLICVLASTWYIRKIGKEKWINNYKNID